MKGRYKRPLTSQNFIGLWKEKRYRRNMMFLFAGHSAGLLSKNFVKQSFTKFLESQLHDSRRKLYLSAPFFFYLRYGWLVRGRLYMPNYAVNCTTESAIYVMELTEFKLWLMPLITWIDGFSQSGYCMPHSLGLIKNRTDLFSGFWERPVLRKQTLRFQKTM